MKSRAITLGASVIALALAGPAQAEAGVLGDLEQQAPETGVAAKVVANVEVPVAAPTKGSLEARARGSARPGTTIEAKHRSGGDRSTAVLDWDSGNGASAYVDQRRKGRVELEAEGQAGSGYAESTVTGFSRPVGRAGAHVRAHTAKAKHPRAKRSIREHSRRVAGTKVPHSPGERAKRLTPLEAIGREVGNPIQLSLAGWLIGLTGAGCLGIARLVRRLGRTS